ncbi:heavy metal-binding domain-containing protein [bacterium]|nr:MAG: YbjQ family protein [candidate division KSB1 bacterium]MCE7943927.1 YbjQ family protein [Chlorobi bacterium CHB1]MCL4706817.1 heavy metal-binding domain-containing protein [bacterium]MDL1877712.1 YbjQ family protein [Cytophagia bacterium CHB2]MBC6948398.1 YbjQ family protein [candidate division KSB1 bacterium]
MIVVTSSTIAGKRIVKTLGMVKGNAVRARHLGKDILALFKNIVGGEIEEYTKLLAESREQSVDRMVAAAEDLGANAVVDTRFSTSYIMANAAEILSFGTAVVVE